MDSRGGIELSKRLWRDSTYDAKMVADSEVRLVLCSITCNVVGSD